MSMTFSLMCQETKQYVWIGQGHGAEMTTLYSGEPATMEALRQFLNATLGKELKFGRDDEPDMESLTEFKAIPQERQLW